MKKAQLCWIITLPLLIILGIGLFFIWQKGAKKEKPAPFKTDVYQEIAGFSLAEYISGEKKMEIKAEKASIRPKKIGFLKTSLIKETHMLKPEIFFYADGREVSRITADAGTVNMSNKRIFLRGGVILLTADGKRLSANHMAVEPKKDLLSIKGRFTLKKGDEIIKGKGLRSDIELKNFKIGGAG